MVARGGGAAALILSKFLLEKLHLNSIDSALKAEPLAVKPHFIRQIDVLSVRNIQSKAA